VRYRVVGRDARVVERGARWLVVELEGGVDPDLVDEVVAVERACCPFFELRWEPDVSRLSIGVSRSEDEPALGAVAFALGLDGEAG
jgi:hypothetical protein